MVAAVCPRCGCGVALHEGRPSITASGAVELWHASCQLLGPVVEAVAVEPIVIPWARTRRRAPHRLGIAGATAALVALVAARLASSNAQIGSVPVACLDIDEPEPLSARAHGIEREGIPPRPVEPTPAERFPIPEIDTVALDEQYPSLHAWIHPVSASAEQVPAQQSRLFGAERHGIMRTECGAGHCGIDLDGPRGRPIVAVASGVVVRVERHELGLDGRSGRYVRIEHDDGVLTAYMHLDDVAADLQVGDHVTAGEYLGTLGASAVYEAVPHLHFSLELPNQPGRHGDNTETRYIDPAPFLARASIADVPERKHAVKPAL